MVRITEDLVRKRSEHNEGEIFSLEELTLHQQDIERIEFLDKHCKKLRILYLQNNLIPKIENISRLKELEYLNLALNNIEVIENLEGCESLKKLELTVNFIGDLTSVENLINLENLEELYLVGNPCTEYAGYREYVIATLPQLKVLDGEEIGKAERIIAFQNLSAHYKTILQSQKAYFAKRARDKKMSEVRKQHFSKKLEESDGDIDKIAEEFWHEKSPYTPESRIETYEFIQLQKERRPKTTTIQSETEPKPRRKVFFAEDGRPYNINEPKVDFKLYEEQKEDGQYFILDLAAFKNMDTSLIDCDVQANYVRVMLRNKRLHF
uniref:LRRcap domain-containing protein n=1 Tax=Mesocestoides corti TaxID=53468 RepID=A0A5K3FHJ1_MESCO